MITPQKVYVNLDLDVGLWKTQTFAAAAWLVIVLIVRVVTISYTLRETVVGHIFINMDSKFTRLMPIKSQHPVLLETIAFVI